MQVLVLNLNKLPLYIGPKAHPPLIVGFGLLLEFHHHECMMHANLQYSQQKVICNIASKREGTMNFTAGCRMHHLNKTHQ